MSPHLLVVTIQDGTATRASSGGERVLLIIEGEHPGDDILLRFFMPRKCLVWSERHLARPFLKDGARLAVEMALRTKATVVSSN